jgi:hypothetical protein
MRCPALAFGILSLFLFLIRLSEQAVAGQDVAIVPAVGGSLSGTTVPFLMQGPGTNVNTARYQQVYDASAFSVLPPAGGLINGMGLRLAPGSDPLPYGDVRDIEIRLSTTGHAVDSLSPIFAENVGINDTPVFLRGRLHLEPNSQVGAFVIPFTAPFLYVPSNGNLLLDVRVYQDFQFTPPPPPSRLLKNSSRV